ncbi:transmembrane protein 176B-like [Corythoichthys intestinalis]|uniref:transmembrane protein 176B-like n=1 Tax=Corythoichthys intestinalis TaxID=161448 RepID=UPI0025A5751E|nr:transmembrane protein 176B-like [Corythoichthys intestinalis]
MTVTVTKANGVTVYTVTSDSQSCLPPFCQLFKDMCYSPRCCSVSQRMKTIMGSSQTLLGSLQIAVGLTTIAIGVLPMFGGYENPWWNMWVNLFSLWMGSVFVLFGAICIFSQKYPSPCLVIINAILNLSGVLFALCNIVLCAINIGVIDMWDVCEFPNEEYSYSRPSRRERDFEERCLQAKDLLLMFLKGINGILLVLAVLELCLVLSSSILAIKALRSNDKSPEDVKEDQTSPEFGDEVILVKP